MLMSSALTGPKAIIAVGPTVIEMNLGSLFMSAASLRYGLIVSLSLSLSRSLMNYTPSSHSTLLGFLSSFV